MSCVEKYDDNVIKPLYFVATESDEEIGRNASICNTAEARAVTEQVEYLCYNWPKSWGEVNIGVAVPYVEQVSFFIFFLIFKKNFKRDIFRGKLFEKC